MKNQIYFLNQTEKKFMYLQKFKTILELFQNQMKISLPIIVDLILIDSNQMKIMCKEYLQKDKVTDILSFPSGALNLKNNDFIHLGEIFICAEKISEQAKKYNHSLTRENCYLFTHGLFHLYGLDHKTLEEETYMNNLTEQIMKKMKVER